MNESRENQSTTNLWRCLFTAGRCIDVGTVKYGTRQGSGTSYGSSVSFSCNSGYGLVGAAQRLCEQSGIWSGQQPRCVRECWLSCLWLFLHLTVARRKHWLNTMSVACTRDQQWVTIWVIAMLIFLFLCINNNYLWLTGADCPQLSAPAHGQIEGYRRETGSTVRVSCDKGYKVHPDSSSFRSCQGNKQWSGADPICQRKN